MNPNDLHVALAQIAPVWLDKRATLEKVLSCVSEASEAKVDLIVFGESLLPGYPYWVSLTDGAKFNDKVQKELHAHYMKASVSIENGDLQELCKLAKDKKVAIYLGTIERPSDRGGHSLYCTLVYIDNNGIIQSTHRKLQPTYEERLTWSPGDGHGLRTHPLKGFTLSGLNCWENWMPLSRTALYGMGTNVHVAVWPGAVRNTIDITRFIALEGRCFSLGVSGLMRKEDFPKNTPHLDLILDNCPDILSDGGTCVAAPDGTWILEPQQNSEDLFYVHLDLQHVLEERQNFDPTGHYSRPSITQLHVDRSRQKAVIIKE